MSEKISLYYQSGNSDKVYHVQLEESDGLYVVNFQYGRRGSTLNTGTKTGVGSSTPTLQAGKFSMTASTTTMTA